MYQSLKPHLYRAPGVMTEMALQDVRVVLAQCCEERCGEQSGWLTAQSMHLCRATALWTRLWLLADVGMTPLPVSNLATNSPQA